MGRPDARRIVVADANLDFVDTLANALELDGFDVMTAGDAAHAEQAVDRHRPRFVLIDLHMPDGCALPCRLRAHYGNDVVLIAVTGSPAERGVIADALRAVDHCFTGPNDLGRLREILARDDARVDEPTASTAAAPGMAAVAS